MSTTHERTLSNGSAKDHPTTKIPNDIATAISAPEALQSSHSPRSELTPGQPSEELQVEDGGLSEDNIVYPHGPQVWLNMITMCLICFLHGLDLTIVAVVIPSLTNQFKTISDIGWYSAVYGLIFSATSFFFGKLYTLFGLKKMLIISLLIFELGSTLCTFAPSSIAFILGRAIAGVGAGGMGAGTLTFIPRCFPLHKRPIMTGALGSAQALGLVSAPLIGGALTDAFSWRACFGINVPLGLAATGVIAYGVRDPTHNPDFALPLREKLRRVDPIGTLLIVPSIVCLLLALQWGGNKYGWNDWRVIVLFCVFIGLLIGFGYIQYLQQEKAVLPPRIIKNRTVLASSLFSLCTNGILAITEYYISIYFQGVRGYAATRSGVLGLPMIAGLTAAGLASAFGTTFIGYYTPFQIATCILAPIASGLITTVDLDDAPSKVALLLGFLGVAVGIGNLAPFTAVTAAIPSKDISVALGVLQFGGGLGSALSIAVSATLFHDRLAAEVARHAPGMNISGLEGHGLRDLRTSLGVDRMKEVLFGYNEAVVQTLYLPLGLGLLTIVATAFTEVKSVKKKRE